MFKMIYNDLRKCLCSLCIQFWFRLINIHIINYLDSLFSPVLIGTDNPSSTVYITVIASRLQQYRLHPYDFQEQIFRHNSFCLVVLLFSDSSLHHFLFIKLHWNKKKLYTNAAPDCIPRIFLTTMSQWFFHVKVFTIATYITQAATPAATLAKTCCSTKFPLHGWCYRCTCAPLEFILRIKY